MIQLIARFKAFHFMISKMDFGIQEVIFFYSPYQILISNTPQNKYKSSDSRIELSKQFDFLKTSKNEFFVKEHFNL